MLPVLTTEIPQNERCDACDRILTSSTFKDRPVAVVFIRRRARIQKVGVRAKYHCIKCQFIRNRISEEELTSFLGLTA